VALRVLEFAHFGKAWVGWPGESQPWALSALLKAGHQRADARCVHVRRVRRGYRCRAFAGCGPGGSRWCAPRREARRRSRRWCGRWRFPGAPPVRVPIAGPPGPAGRSAPAPVCKAAAPRVGWSAQGGVEVLLSRRYGADGLDKLDVRRLFEQVAGRAGGERPAQVDHVVVGGQDKHPSVRTSASPAVAAMPLAPGRPRSMARTPGRVRAASSTASSAVPPRRPPRCRALRAGCGAARCGPWCGRRTVPPGSAYPTGTSAMMRVPRPSRESTESTPPARSAVPVCRPGRENGASRRPGRTRSRHPRRSPAARG